MSDAPSAWSRALQGAALAAAGLALLVLLYALATRALAPGPAPDAAAARPPGEPLRLEVLNGCGVAGVAREATLFLRRYHFDVLQSGNFHTFSQEHSLVIDRAGRPEAALSVAAALGIDRAYVREEVDPRLLLDVTVVIGCDYALLRPFEDAGL